MKQKEEQVKLDEKIQNQGPATLKSNGCLSNLYKRFKPTKSPILVIFLLLIFGLVLIFVPYLMTTRSILALKYEQIGEIGDIISGTTMPFISFAGIMLTFLAFWIQYKANLELRRDIEIDRFASRYYELLKLHKENVSEMEIDGKYKGREVFKALHQELKFIYWLIENELNGMKEQGDVSRSSPQKILSIAYLIFYYGFETNKVNYVNAHLKNICSPNEEDKVVKELTRQYEKLRSAGRYVEGRVAEVKVGNLSERFLFRHSPFQGQMSRLGHYYRHLFQTVRFIDGISDERLNHEEKYGFAKTIRGQLSVFEQAMLYYNALSSIGAPWLKCENPLLTKYRLIKNMPPNLADFGPNPKDKFNVEIEEYKKISKNFFEFS